MKAGEVLTIALVITIVVTGLALEVMEWRRKRRVEKNHSDYKNTRIKQ